ncbi:tRNA 2-selenouridine(34) synthase MnmH [Achromobacter marplatensis]|uniref:tRNA 2-selenouridine synthase n=1 Tax=Achromobacter marplatensis TaxID=470868 RepID=A0ABX9GCX1_9BURK|nr:tRNA 2-selenouridine(34) synthase MnmH [Achromobacter marplatensis]OWT67657.1 tRNA 2-selenouridine(34) synthase MnmH [Achromobacter marplatensis]RBP19880.1 tRNA 2-selenouridine synthase [Achromobacter marplatensis]CAB3636296.1 tRNA 2-selenouridine synthase [Achromobacter marplatensis]
MKHLLASLDKLADFDEIIDVRSPLEYADDHIPGAINAPVLSNEERAQVGTLYRQVSPFEASRTGAAIVARNIARHLETTFADRPQGWRPLVYCWRGGKRSGSMTVMFNMIGWRARQLDGGYKTYRGATLQALDTLPAALRCVVLVGPTGSGKTRLLNALDQAGAQTLDLEQLASHRGSLLGALPGIAQPSQKRFDTLLAARLRAFDASQAVYVEAESRKIGSVALPPALLQAMHRGACIEVVSSREDRAAFLQQDYAQLFENPDWLKTQLQRLLGLHSRDVINGWLKMVDEGRRIDLARELIDRHYDPAYARSSHTHFTQLPQATRMAFRPNDADGVEQARALLKALA